MRFLILISLLLCHFVSFGNTAQPQAVQSELDEQLEINRTTLLNSSDEAIRLKAASLILHNETSQARSILLDILTKTDNPAARTAICESLINNDTEISGKESFIKPLVGLIAGKEPDLSKLAARALLVFDYKQVDSPLLAKINDDKLDIDARANVIYALKIQPDINAIIRLIELLDNPNKEIVSASGQALSSLGIPAVGADAATKKQIIKDLRRIGKDEFIKVYQMRREYEDRLEQLRKERKIWQDKALALLDELYVKTGTDETNKIAFLSQYLNSTESQERLWAVNKVLQWWKGTDAKTKVLSDIGPILIKLIADDDRDVRFNTAKLLSFMGELNSAEALLKQISIEKDPEVKIEQFIALGQACRYAFSPQSAFKLDDAIRIQTLDMAADYVLSGSTYQGQKGAEVIRNNLEHNGLGEDKAEKYLQSLAQRYKQDSTDDTLRSELLNSMAMLCAGGAYRQRAIEIYERLFAASLNDKNDIAREAAVNGLINISKSQALGKLRNDFTNDSNVNIRKKLIALAEEAGTGQDLPWLFDKLGKNSEGASSWKAMLKIFERSDAELMKQWSAKIEADRVDATQKISFFEILEQKAEKAGNAELENDTKLKLARLYQQINEFDQASKYLAEVIKKQTNPKQKELLTSELLQLYLNNNQTGPAISLISNQLMENDFGIDDPVGKVLLDFMKSSSANSQSLAEELAKIDIKQAGERPKWQQLLSNLTQKEETPPKPSEKTDLSQKS